MLIQFNFKNFKSFRDEATLDLSATEEKSFAERIITVGMERILPVAAIYGANASGKTNVYNAFEYMSEYVVYSFQYDDDDKESKFRRVTPFMFDSQSADAESTFEVYFTLPLDSSGKVYNYGFSLNKNEILEEWLNSKAKSAKKYSTIFYRNTVTKELDLSGIPEKSRENISIALENRVLISSLGAKLKIEKCKLVRDWFFANEFANFGDPFTDFLVSTRLPKDFVEHESVQKKVVKYLASFDDHIKGFTIEEIPNTEEKKTPRYSIHSLHNMIDSSGTAEISLRAESAGTLKMFVLYPELQKVLERGSVFFVDELNARLHPLLVRNFLITFLNQKTNPNHAQLIFTTHDTWHLSNRLLRPDEIWFAEKDEKGISSLYSLADFEDDNEQEANINYEELYLTGRYGAIPKMKLLQILGGVSNG